MNHAIQLAHVVEKKEYSWKFNEAACQYDPDLRMIQIQMNSKPRPSFTPALMNDLQNFQSRVRQTIDSELVKQNDSPFEYLVLASAIPGVFNLGGDLTFFLESIRNRRRDTLEAYAIQCIDVLYGNYRNLDRKITTLALIEGDALGAAFEAALSADIIIAEKGVQIGFPEVIFNMFPGMGAYSFLARRVAPSTVERMITSGKLYTSDELFEMGVVDVLAEKGEGQQALSQFIRKHKRTASTRNAVFTMRDKVFPVAYEELKEIAMLWVDTAMNLPQRDQKMMERLIKAQNKKADNTKTVA